MTTSFKELKEAKQGLTHGGCFHTDDIFSTALLKYINPEIKIKRTFNVPEDFEGIVYDIGLKEFDHHQADKLYRENDVPYAAFGLLWNVIGPELIGPENSADFDEKFIQPLDWQDNYGGDNLLCRAFKSFNPKWDDDKNADEEFNKAVEFALLILENEISTYLSRDKAKEIILEDYSKSPNKKICILSKGMPWKETLAPTDAMLVIYPSLRGGYNIQAVPEPDDPTELKTYFPHEWGGLNDSELEAESGIEGITFAHTGQFLCSAKTLDAAIEVASKVIYVD